MYRINKFLIIVFSFYTLEMIFLYQNLNTIIAKMYNAVNKVLTPPLNILFLTRVTAIFLIICLCNNQWIASAISECLTS